ncbi:unnamed protein product [Caenorhabditis auriculariae]|uniref:CX domain-containing protein n=1 Tax=Caenorhabditis auriculariae TaxID=2777116 RepID=A0A8S1H771_9PELO|nr:unnamed protein product [Caenorhabditis auriculariae]
MRGFLVMKTIVSIILISCGWSSSAEMCRDSFSARATADVVRSVVGAVADESRAEDVFGEVWLNLIIPSNISVKVKNAEYFFNDDRFSAKDSFSFEVTQFFAFPVVVVDPQEVPEWRADLPGDSGKLLKKISRKCSRGEYLCGLECCPNLVQAVQNDFSMKAGGSTINRTTVVKRGNIVYKLQYKPNKENVTSCVYHLSTYDSLQKYTDQKNVKLEYIYYDCPIEEDCCTLSCRSSSRSFLALASILSTERLVDRYFWPFVAVSLFVAFLVVVFCHCRNRKCMAKQMRVSATARSSSDRPLLETPTSDIGCDFSTLPKSIPRA